MTAENKNKLLISGAVLRSVGKDLSTQDIGISGSDQRLEAVISVVAKRLPQESSRQFSKKKAFYLEDYERQKRLAEHRLGEKGITRSVDHIPEIIPSNVREMDELDILRLMVVSAFHSLSRPDISKAVDILAQKDRQGNPPQHRFTTTGLELEIIRSSPNLIQTWRKDAAVIDLLQSLGIKVSYDGIREIALPYSDISLQLRAMEELYGLGILKETDALGIHPNFGFKNREVMFVNDPSPMILQLAMDAADFFGMAEANPESATTEAPVYIYEQKPLVVSNGKTGTPDIKGLPILFRGRGVLEYRSLPLITDFDQFSNDLKTFGELVEMWSASRVPRSSIDWPLARGLDQLWNQFGHDFSQLLINYELPQARFFLKNHASNIMHANQSYSLQCGWVRGSVVYRSATDPKFKEAVRDLINEAVVSSLEIKHG